MQFSSNKSQGKNSQRKLIVFLVLIVLLPLLLLAWQAWKISQDTEKLNAARFDSLVTARLNQIDTVVQSYFEEMQLKWSLLIPQWQLDKNATRERIENDGNIRQIFVIDTQQIRTFPPQDNEITTAEKNFVDRLETVWRDPQILFSNQSNNIDLEQVASLKKSTPKKIVVASVSKADKSQRQSRSKSTSEPMPDAITSADNTGLDSVEAESSSELSYNSGANFSAANTALPSTSKIIQRKKAKPVSGSNNKQGWYMWYWGNDVNLIFWQQNEDSSIVGIEMEPVRVKSDLISRLPDTPPNQSKDFRLRLSDTAGNVVYQWGNYDALNESPQQRRAVSYPLSSWSLEYYGKAFNQAGFSGFNLWLSLLGFGALISALAWFLYREQTREMRLATQRVDFVSQVSHELKTPLTNIRMYAEMLEQQVPDAEQPKRYLQVITDESKRLTRLISNVLNFSRAPRIHNREVIPDEVIKQSIKHFAPSFAAKQMELKTDLNTSETVVTDPDMLEQILNNLLSNVEKYVANGKLVDIQSNFVKDNMILRVRDYGDGISRTERKHIFDAFYRINDKLTEGVSGTGIGLTIARQQAEYLNGELKYIEVNSGACFELTLPRAKD